MTLPNRLIACVLIWIIVTASAGCATMKPVRIETDPAAPAFGSVKVGETVDVETRAGRRVRIVVRSIERDAIVSTAGERYVRGDLVQLKRQTRWNAKSVWLTAGILYVLFMAAAEALKA